MSGPSFEQNMRPSAEDFLKIVWPRLKVVLGGGRLIPVETVTNAEFGKELDVLAGIDAWHIFGNGMGMAGIASRVQWRVHPVTKEQAPSSFGEHGYQTFAIRTAVKGGGKTELDKRLFAVMSEPGAVLYPTVTVQAYLDKHKGRLLSAATIATRELILFAVKHRHRYDDLANKQDRNRFIAIPWRDLIGTMSLQMLSGDDEDDRQQALAFA